MENVAPATPFVARVDLRVPSVSNVDALPPNSECTYPLCSLGLRLFDDNGLSVSPRLGGSVYVTVVLH